MALDGAPIKAALAEKPDIDAHVSTLESEIGDIKQTSNDILAQLKLLSAEKTVSQAAVDNTIQLEDWGQMVIVSLAVDEDGQYIGRSKRVKNGIFKRMATHWADMVTEGKITQEEFVDTNFNMYFPTIEEFSAPFNDPQSKVSQSGLQLVSIETQLVPCHYHSTWEASDKKGEPEAALAYAKLFAPSTRRWANSTFMSALNTSRTDEEKDQLIDEFFARYEADVASAPGDHGIDYIQAYIHIQKST